MKTIDGKFFDGLRPVPVPGRLDLSGTDATLTAGALSVQYDRAALIVSPRIAGSERFITFPDGMQILCRDEAFLETLPQESPSEGLVAWLAYVAILWRLVAIRFGPNWPPPIPTVIPCPAIQRTASW